MSAYEDLAYYQQDLQESRDDTVESRTVARRLRQIAKPLSQKAARERRMRHALTVYADRCATSGGRTDARAVWLRVSAWAWSARKWPA